MNPEPDAHLFDYLLLPYAPPRPAAGKAQSVDVLLESFARMGVAEEGGRVVAALTEELGPSRTVWGIKHAADRPGVLSWELYVYRREGRGGEPSPAKVLAALAPHLRFAARPAPPPRWELLSFELDAEGLAAGRGGDIDAYVGMRAYRAVGRDLEFKNYYTFGDPGLRLDRILERLLAGVHAPRDGAGIERLLPSWLLAGCPRVCVANKRHADGLYFSHLRLEQLLSFLDTHGWPADFRAWLAGRAGRLDHLLWDAGFDFRRAGRDLDLFRSAFYGFF